MMCIKTKKITPFFADSYVHVPRGDSHAYVAVRCNLKINPFNVVAKTSRIYPNVPETSQIGNLPVIYLRANGKTTKTGNLTGISYRAEKDGQVNDYFFGKLWVEPAVR